MVERASRSPPTTEAGSPSGYPTASLVVAVRGQPHYAIGYWLTDRATILALLTPASTVASMDVSLPLLPVLSWFHHENWPVMPCGQCSSGFLRPATTSIIDLSQPQRDHPDWGPEWVKGYWTGESECTNQHCQHAAALVGHMELREEDLWGMGHFTWERFLRIRYVEPPLRLANLPSQCPVDVREQVEVASRIIWADAASAATRLRSAVELLLTTLGVATQTSKGKRSPLHQRIDELRKTKPELADVIEAVKWIGNAGSHAEESTGEEVLKAVAMLEHAVALEYDTRGIDIASLAEQVNERNRSSNQRPS